MHKRALQHDNEEVVKLKPLGSNGFYTNSLDLTFRSQRDNYLLSNPNLFCNGYFGLHCIFGRIFLKWVCCGWALNIKGLIPYQTLFDFHSTLISFNSAWAQTIMGYRVVFIGSEKPLQQSEFIITRFTNKAGDNLS